MKNQPVVVVRKRRSSAHQAAHGGAWKIAYADFMTAMMAFFLVMWLLSIASPKDLTTIAEYFRTPLATALTNGPRSSSDSSPIPGGGADPTRQQGDIHKNIKTDANKSIDALMQKLEKKRLNQLRERLDQLIESDPRLRVLRPQLLINMVEEGLRIQILDSQNRPMFETGSATVEPYMRDVLRGIAPILNDIPNKISISGHTDATPYADGERGYSNWELSADRANASRRELITGGLSGEKILRVVGMSSTMSLAPKQPDAAINRRISLVVLNKQTEEMIEHENAENPGVDVNGTRDLIQQTGTKPGAGGPSSAPAQSTTPGGSQPEAVNPAPAPADASQPAVPGSGASAVPSGESSPAQPGAGGNVANMPGGNTPSASAGTPTPSVGGKSSPAASDKGATIPPPQAVSTPARKTRSAISTAVTPAPDARTLIPTSAPSPRAALWGDDIKRPGMPSRALASAIPYTVPEAVVAGIRNKRLPGRQYQVGVIRRFEVVTGHQQLTV